MKSTHLLSMVVLFAAGAARMLRSYRDEGSPKEKSKETADAPPARAAREQTAGIFPRNQVNNRRIIITSC